MLNNQMLMQIRGKVPLFVRNAIIVKFIVCNHSWWVCFLLCLV